MAPNNTKAKDDRTRAFITVQEELVPVKEKLNAIGYPDKEIFNERVRELGIQFGFLKTGKTVEMGMHLRGPVEATESRTQTMES